MSRATHSFSHETRQVSKSRCVVRLTSRGSASAPLGAGKAVALAGGKLVTSHARLLHVEQALQDVAALVARRVALKRLTLTIRVESGTPLIPINEPTFKMICYNLLECAINVAPEKGVVLVVAGPAPVREPSGEDSLVFVVSENGHALAESDPERVARGYEQLDEGPTGEPQTQSGRLLVSTRRVVEGLGGKLWVKSEPRKGNAMTCVLPVGRSPL